MSKQHCSDFYGDDSTETLSGLTVAGTGKTLVARALAATASKAGTKVSFFMRKGADVLSKWVGEAERQLRLLFEEAQKAQPAIIFFDEIDGLAPVSHHNQHLQCCLLLCQLRSEPSPGACCCTHFFILGMDFLFGRDFILGGVFF